MRLLILSLALVGCAPTNLGKEVIYNEMSGGGFCCGIITRVVDKGYLVTLTQCKDTTLYSPGDEVYSERKDTIILD